MKKLIFVTSIILAVVLLGVTGESEAKPTEAIEFIPLTEEEIARHYASQKTETKEVVESVDTSYSISNEDVALIARVVMSEASIEPYECKVAVAQTVLNRLYSHKWGDTLEEVVYYENAFSTQDNGTPTLDCINAVIEAFVKMDYPSDMYYFRTGHYHNFGVDYMQIGITYFSREGE